MAERGEVKDRKRYLQVRDFRNMRWGNITPTDIDGAVEFHNKLTIYIELKYGDKKIDTGQRLFLERQNDDIERAGKPCFTIVARHYIPPEQDIDVASCEVVGYRSGRQWKIPKGNYTVKTFIDEVLKRNNIHFPEQSSHESLTACANNAGVWN